MTAPTVCRVCEGAYKDPIEDRLKAGYSLLAIITEARENGFIINEVALSDHLAHTPGLITGATIDARNLPAPGRVAYDPLHKDLAIAVRDAVFDKMSDKDSKMELKVEHGLKAQQIIENRIERDKDRVFQLNLARLLSGGGGLAPTALIEPKNVTPDDDDDDDAGALLAPPELRASAAI